MSTEVALPALGESVTEGTVSRWLKQVGDAVAVDEPLVEISTDKVDTEIPSPVAGTLIEIRVNEDETVEVGAVLGVVGESGEAGGSADDSTGETADQAAEPVAAPAAQAAPEPVADAEQPQPAPSEEAAEPEPAEQPAAAAESAPPAPAAPSGSSGGTEVTLPALGESVTEGTVSRWLKQVGDPVSVDEPLVEISTDKVDTEIPSPVEGTITEIRVSEDETVEVGGVLAVIGGAPAAETDEPEAADPGTTEQAAPAEQAQAAAEPQAPQPDSADDLSEQPDAGDEGGQAPIPTPAAESAPAPAGKPAEEKPAEEKPAPAKQAPLAPRRAAEPHASAETVYVTPLVRKLAAEHDVDLDTLEGTGVGGRIRKQDVLAAAEAAQQAAAQAGQPDPEPAKAPAASAPTTAVASSSPSPEAVALRGTTEKMSRIRATIARRMVESLQVSAQLTATVEVDLTKISRLRQQVKNDFVQREGVKLSYLPFITKAVVETLKVYPKVNARIDTEAGTISYSDAEHVGVAVDTEKGLMVPVIKDAGDLNIAGLAKKITDLATRSRSNQLTPDDLSGGTFTITNYGSAGTLMDTPIINQPQVAILGTGALVKRPVVISSADLGDTIVVRDMMYLSMSYDHRLVDGADAARFLSALKARLEEADFEAELGL